MGIESSSLVDIPDLKLKKVGKDRERKRGGIWFSGGVAGGSGGFMGTGMTLAKVLVVLLVSGGASVGAWQMGNMLAGGPPAGGKLAPPRVFSPKDAQYDDLSGVIKPENSIPNSLGYVNDDGLTDEQRAAKKAAADAAARKAAEDAQKQADAAAKRQAIEDAKAAATPASRPARSPAPQNGNGLAAGRFGALTSGLSGGGGALLSGGAGLSGGITRSFGAVPNLGAKNPNGGLGGGLGAFRAGARPSSMRAAPAPHASSNSKGFAKQQLDMANGMSRAALASGQSENASAGAGTPFDNNSAQGSVISGPGVGAGVQSGAAAGAGSGNPTNSSPAACPNANYAPDASGNCVNQTASPTMVNAAPYQGMVNTVKILMGVVAVVAMIGMMVPAMFWPIVGAILGMLGAVIAGFGAKIASMAGGDFMIGAIVTTVGSFVTASGAAMAFGLLSSSTAIIAPAAALIAASLGELATMSSKSANLM